MNLLIVDDQPQVVKGLLSGVNWNDEGFSNIYAAYTAAEARRIINLNPIDVMLCDIEMPVESGLDLVEWMRSQNIYTRCIFLTSHMSFQYAQRALRLGSVDYLVLPAPYNSIQAAVRKAVQEINTENEREKLTQYGQILQEQQDTFVEGLLYRFLNSGEKTGLAEAQKIGKLPADDQACHVVLIQTLRLEGRLEQLDTPTLDFAINNIINELFSEYGQKTYCIRQEDGALYYLIFSNEYQIPTDAVIRQLEQLNGFSRQYLQCILASYTDYAISISQLPDQLTLLKEHSNDNVSMQSGVFLISQNEAELSNPTNDIISQPLYSRLRQHITAGYFDAAKMEITRIIEYQQQSNLNAATLTGLYKTIIQLLGEAMSKHKISIEELYPDQESFSLYQDGWKSLNQLRKLVTNTFNQLQILITDNNNQDFSIDQIINYIHDHIEEDIRRIDLAQQFHLNPDYLARVFKNETGQTLKHYISQEKINIAKGLLRTTNLPVGMIAAKIGFSSLSHFSKVYQKLTGLTPTEERTATK